MKDFRKFQKVRILTVEGTIAHGDYICDGVTIRTRNGFLCDLPDENGNMLPAIETHDGSHVEHWKDGVLHCEEGPAVIDAVDNYEHWFYEGKEVKPKD